VPILADATAQVKIESTETAIRVAAEQFLARARTASATWPWPSWKAKCAK